jgi:hypothetical protein
MTAQLRIAVSETDDVLKIPNQALRFRFGVTVHKRVMPLWFQRTPSGTPSV